MHYKLDIKDNTMSISEFFNNEINKASEGYDTFCCDILYANIRGFLESMHLPRGLNKRADQVADLMAYTLCHTIIDCTKEEDLLYQLELLSIYKPSTRDQVEMLLYVPVQYISVLNSLPSKQSYMNNIDQIRFKQYPMFENFYSELQGGLQYLLKTLQPPSR